MSFLESFIFVKVLNENNIPVLNTLVQIFGRKACNVKSCNYLGT
jgi:hypothetical protein